MYEESGILRQNARVTPEHRDDYQELVDENLVEKRRGLGMYVTDGARDALLKSERERFLREEWPPLSARLARLGLDLRELLADAGKEESR